MGNYRKLTVLLILSILIASIVPTAFAAGETFKVVSVDATGCNDREFTMTIERANLDGGTYIVHTVVTVDNLIYMNERANIISNGPLTWRIWDLFNYGAVPNPGTYPIPAGQEMRLDFTLERPIGTVLYAWTLIVDGCDTGNILYNGVTTSDAADSSVCKLIIPVGAVVGNAPFGAQAYYAPGEISPGVVLNPGTYIVTGQDESETYYQIVLACQLLWVRKDTMQPSNEAPQNGAPLPTVIVG